MYAILATISLAVLGQAAPEEKDAEFLQSQQKKWEELYRTEAATYEIMLDADSEKALKLKPEPVLLWSNPVRRGETNGSVFVWTYEGRAEVVGTVFSHLSGPDQRKIAHSFHSLSMGPIEAKRHRQPSWSMTVPGIEPEKIPGAPAPSDSRAMRLTQMRDLAREFSATTTLDGVVQELRLLPQPLHRNERATKDVVDGALFTFVTGTDPELMLVIEARGQGDDTAWYYGAGRFTDLVLRLNHKDASVWTYAQGLVEDKESPYLSRRTEIRNRYLP